MSNGIINLMLACNDRYGNWDDKVRKLDIEELDLEIELAGFPEDGIPYQVRKSDERWQGKGGPYIKVGDFREITTYSYRRHVGNICWDCALCLPPEVAELINHLIATKQAHCTAGPCEIFDKLDAGQPITAHDLCPEWIAQ